MIAEHQPKLLPAGIIVGLSSVEDGTMKHAPEMLESEVRTNRVTFLAQVAIELSRTNLILIDYAGDDYCRYVKAPSDTEGISMELSHETTPYDGMMTDQPEQAIFLPIADCCPMIIADRNSNAFMVSHLGRHNVEQQGARKSVEALCDTFGCEPSQLDIWLGPMVGKDTYPMRAFDGRGLEEVIREQLAEAGIVGDQISSIGVDTAKDERYFSHSEFLKGNRPVDGRHAVVAMRRSAA